MRAFFWIKAFSMSQKSKEYKTFAIAEQNKWGMLAILNSSLFWWHWVVVSDCWHITKKELSTFRINMQCLQSSELQTLAIQLETELENTKVEINSKQTAFEYKHKFCRTTIDKIDDYLAEFYRLTANETEYIKNFAKKYRDSLG
ncbi:MAG: hypothetical protein FWG64_01590 [Firmicutes bacterium]|nr:hypothetical protein [Bacillota bacterium]